MVDLSVHPALDIHAVFPCIIERVDAVRAVVRRRYKRRSLDNGIKLAAAVVVLWRRQLVVRQQPVRPRTPKAFSIAELRHHSLTLLLRHTAPQVVAVRALLRGDLTATGTVGIAEIRKTDILPCGCVTRMRARFGTISTVCIKRVVRESSLGTVFGSHGTRSGAVGTGRGAIGTDSNVYVRTLLAHQPCSDQFVHRFGDLRLG